MSGLILSTTKIKEEERKRGGREKPSLAACETCYRMNSRQGWIKHTVGQVGSHPHRKTAVENKPYHFLLTCSFGDWGISLHNQENNRLLSQWEKFNKCSITHLHHHCRWQELYYMILMPCFFLMAVFFSDSICLQWATKHFNLLPVELDCNVQAEMREKWI